MKKKVVKIVVILLILIIGIGQIPIPHSVSIKETAIEYSLTDEGVAIPHEVFIEGRYYTRFIGKDRFSGVFYVSDVEGLEKDMWLDAWFHPFRRYHPSFNKPTGEAMTTEIGMLFFDRNFKNLAIQLAFAYIEQEDGRSVSFGDSRSNFIVLGSMDREDALNQYQQILAEKGKKV